MTIRFLVAAWIVLMGCSSPQEEKQKASPKDTSVPEEEAKQDEEQAATERGEEPHARELTLDREAVLTAISGSEDSMMEIAVKKCAARHSWGDVQSCEVASQQIITLSSTHARFTVNFTCHIQPRDQTGARDVTQAVEGTATQKDGEWVIKPVLTIR